MGPFGGFGTEFKLFAGFALVVFVAVFGLIIGAVVKQARLATRNNAAPEVSAVAAVVDKHIDSSGGGDSVIVEHHLVSFEQPGGERFELEVPANEYGLLVVGDRGSVTMKGTQYRGFAREIMR